MGRGHPSKTEEVNFKNTRRGYGKKKGKNKLDLINGSSKNMNFTIFASNCNGLKGKTDSLLSSVKSLDFPSCVCLQETKCIYPGMFQIDGYQVFEKVRKSKGGGLLTAVSHNLKPVLIAPVNDDVEILVVQIHISEQKYRIINAYGPQEISQSLRTVEEQQQIVLEFWNAMEREVVNSYEEGCGLILELDANAKVGNSVIDGDPN